MKAYLGDKVKIVEPGRLYSAYDTAAKVMGLKLWKCYYDDLDKDKVYLVLNDFNHHKHKSSRLLGITDGRHDFVIGEEGVTVVDPGTIMVPSPPKKIEVQYFDINNISL